MSMLKRVSGVLSAVAVAVLLPINGSQAATYFYHNDHLGTPQALTDKNQQVVWRGEQQPFGEVDATTNAVEQNIRFPGQYYDLETRLHYNYFRDYDPSTGRYITSDPIGINGGVNTYTYAYSSPTVGYDPLGLEVLSCGYEFTAIFAIFGAKVNGGLYFDTDTIDFGFYSGVPTEALGVAAGVEFGAVISADVTKDMSTFRGDTLETGFGMGPFGFDTAIVPGVGFVAGGLDFGPAYGASVARFDTSIHSVPDTLRGISSQMIDALDHYISKQCPICD